MYIAQIDLLGSDTGALEWYQMFFRAGIVFITALVFIRFAGMRSFGTQSSFDVVLSITLGGVLSRAITGQYPFFACLGTALVLALLHRLIAFLSYRNKSINKVVEGEVNQLYDGAAMNQKNLARHSIAHTEVMQALRENNLEDFSKVKSIWFEPDGKISVIKKEKQAFYP